MVSISGGWSTSLSLNRKWRYIAVSPWLFSVPGTGTMYGGLNAGGMKDGGVVQEERKRKKDKRERKSHRRDRICCWGRGWGIEKGTKDLPEKWWCAAAPVNPRDCAAYFFFLLYRDKTLNFSSSTIYLSRPLQASHQLVQSPRFSWFFSLGWYLHPRKPR